MTDDDKALVERLKRFSTRPIEHDAPAMNRVAMKEAAERIESQAAEIERISSQRDAYLDGYKKAFEDVVKLHDALRNIQIEAEREQGSWVHLKRVIALNCKQTLAALEQSK